MKILALICLVSIVGLTSCGVVQYVNVPVDYAPKTGFPKDSTTIVVVNRFLPDSVKIRNRRERSVYKAGAFTAIKTATEQLNALHGVNAISLVDSLDFTQNPDSIKFLAKKYKADYVLTLNDFKGGMVLDNSDGQYAYYNAAVKADFTLFEGRSILFKKMSGEAEVPQGGEYPGGIAAIFSHATVRGSSFAVNEAARNATLDALKDYLPSTIWHNRPLYNNDDNLRSSVSQIMAGRFDMAFKVLNPLIDGPDAKVASMAAYNLAVVYEAQGDIEAALDTAKLSNQKQQNTYATTLIADLIKE